MDGVTLETEVFSEVEALRHKVRNGRHATSVLLLVFGGLTAVSLVITAPNSIWPVMVYLWLLAGPVGFLLTGWHYRRQAVRTGVGQGPGSYLSLGVGGLIAMIFLFPLVAIFGMPFTAVGLELIVIARRQRNLFLGVFGALFGLVGRLEVGFFTLSNLLGRLNNWTGLVGPYSYAEWGQSIVLTLLAIRMLAGGFVALNRERRLS